MDAPRALRVAAALELATVLVLFANLATAHLRPVTSAVGPVHGCAYLLTIILTFGLSASKGTRLLSFVPAVGGLLVLRQLARTARSSTSSPRDELPPLGPAGPTAGWSGGPPRR